MRRVQRNIILLVAGFVCLLLLRTNATAQVGPYAEAPEIPAWAAERARRARMGRREIVQVPLVRRSDGWGCICPEYYIGLSTVNAASSTWIEPRFARKNLRLSKNTLVVAEGYFTGRRIRRDLRDNPDAPKEWIYRLWEFRVTRIRQLPEDHQAYDEENALNRVAIKPRASNRRT